MAVSFSVPSSPSKSIYQINTFQGCDFTNSPATVDDYKSPNCVNMIRDVPGKIRKSMGYELVRDYYEPINGFYNFRNVSTQLIHAGDKICYKNIILYNNANNNRSKAWQFDDKLYIQDGKEWLVHWREVGSGSEYFGSHTVDAKSDIQTIKVTPSLYTDTIYFEFGDGVDKVVVIEGSSTTVYKLPILTCKEFSYQPSTTTTFEIYFYENNWQESTKSGETWYITSLYETFKSGIDNCEVNLYLHGDSGWTNVETVILNEGETYQITQDGDDAYSQLLIRPLTTVVDNTITEPLVKENERYWYRVNQTYSVEETIEVTANTATAVTVEYLVDTHTASSFDLQYDSTTGKWTNSEKSIKDVSITDMFIHFDAGNPPTDAKIEFSHEGINSTTRTDYLKTQTHGTTRWTVGRKPDSKGFIDDTDGEYIDEEGYTWHIKKLSEFAYVPTVTISKYASGGGTSLEALNLIQPYFIETFYGSHPEASGSETVEVEDATFQLSFSGLDDSLVYAWVLNSDGEWVEKTQGTDFTVNRTEGTVTFITKPGVTPIDGEVNVKIKAARTVEGYADRINKTTISTLFGVNGNADRIFASGNPDYINYDWYCQYNDPTYWGDTWYSALGSSSSAIIGYSVVSNYLAAHKDDYERDANIILREGDLVDNDATFKIVASLQGAGAVAPWSFAYLETEPMFLTKRGIYAVTAQDITGEKYSQNRSYYLDGKLLKEENLENAYACIFNDFYVLAINSHLYILDGLQPIQTDKSMPYATRQYAGFYRENVNARCIWSFEDELYFGTPSGKVYKFFTDKYDLESYNDDGEAIECVWESPDLDGKYFFKNKTFRFISVKLDSALSTSINIYAMKRGLWKFLKSDNKTARYFTFPSLDFSRFSFSTDQTQRLLHTKMRLKKVDKARFRLTNTNLNEPFGLYDVALEYIENGNYKG